MELHLTPEFEFALTLQGQSPGVLHLTTAQAPITLDLAAVILGAQGPKGDSGNTYLHNQSAMSDVWVVNHNLGFRPSAQVMGPGGAQIFSEVLHMSSNQLQVYFDSPQRGMVACS